MTRRLVLASVATLTLALLAIQLVPYRVDNPPVRAEPMWDSPQTRALAVRACFDCHSNEVRVPWYGQIAPIAWLVRDHVDEGRAVLNFSTWDTPQPEAHEAGETVLEGEMPPAYYLALHPEARLTAAEQTALVAGLDATLGGERGGHGHADGDEDDDD